LLPLLWGCRSEKKRIWTILFAIAAIFSAISISLATVSTLYIHSYCIMCVLSFGINFLILYFSWLIRNRYEVNRFLNDLKEDALYLWKIKMKSGIIFFPFFCCVILFFFFFPRYWEFKTPASYSALPVGITQDGHPWTGAQHPVLEIMEYTDYQCFQCKKMHFYLRQIIMENPDKIRLIHRHYPLDNKYNFAVKEAFHVGSGELALLAIYASTKGKFWEMNDLLFNLHIKEGSIKVKDLADKVGLDFPELIRSLHSKSILNALRIDLWEGYKLGITGTPSYVINGKVYKGQIPPEILNSVIGY
jgi:protein-disulfide isomerase